MSVRGVSCLVCRDKKKRHYVLVVTTQGGDGDGSHDHQAALGSMEERWKKVKAALATRMGLGRAGLNTLDNEDVKLFGKELERIAGNGGGGEGETEEERVLQLSVTPGGKAEIEDRVVVIVDEKAVWEGLDVHKKNVQVVDVDAPVKKVSVDSPGDLADVVKRLTAVKIHDDDGNNAEDSKKQQQQQQASTEKKKKDGKKGGKDDKKAGVVEEAFRDSIPDAVDEIMDVVTAALAGNDNSEQTASALRADEDVRESLIDVVLGLKNAAYARGLAAATATQSMIR